jgi:nitrate/TMAO reductase-like tetraheme cytochrome c subunit
VAQKTGSKSGRRRWRVRLLVAALLVIALSYPAVELTSGAGFCKSCHVISLAHDSWTRSEHAVDQKTGKARATCRECHVPSWKEPWAVVAVKLKHGFGDLYHHLAGHARPTDPEYYFGLKQKTLGDVSDKLCLRCHQDIYKKDVRTNEESGEVRGLHSNEETRKVRCIVCHKNTGHDVYF